MQDHVLLFAVLFFGMPFALAFLKAFLRPQGLGRARKKLPRAFRAYNPYVIDGDTLSADGVRIRLAGIDAPERGQAQGHHSTSHLKGLLRDKDVKIIPLEYDKYGRIVAKCVCNGNDICRQMVVDGYAVSDNFTKKYSAEMRRAKRKRSGLWAQGKIQDPRAFRKSIPA